MQGKLGQHGPNKNARSQFRGDDDINSIHSRGRSKPPAAKTGKKAWETGSRHSSMQNNSINRVFKERK